MIPRLLVAIACAIGLLFGDVAIGQVQSDSFKFSDGRSQAISVPLTGSNGAAEIAWPDAANADWEQGPEPDITYLRRGPRSNELFYVYDQESVKPMIDKFLGDRGR